MLGLNFLFPFLYTGIPLEFCSHLIFQRGLHIVVVGSRSAAPRLIHQNGCVHIMLHTLLLYLVFIR